MQDHKLYTALSYAGAIPFVLCALLPFVGIDTVPNVGRLNLVVETYGLAIASFVAGSHWGTFLYNREICPTNLFVTSNIIVLACWFAFLLTGPVLTVFVLVLAFAYLLLIDLTLHKAQLTTDGYFAVRRNVSYIVIASLMLVLFQAAS